MKQWAECEKEANELAIKKSELQMEAEHESYNIDGLRDPERGAA